MPKAKEFDAFRDGYHTENEIEICYWRKCWDFRNEIIDSELGISCDAQWKDGDKIVEDRFLTIPQLEEFREILAKYTDFEYVKEHNENSVWDDDELVSIMNANLDSLDRFISLMKQSPGLKVYFYDSY